MAGALIAARIEAGRSVVVTLAAAVLLVVLVSGVCEDTVTVLVSVAATRIRVRVRMVTVAPGASVPSEQ